jgi:hypothetical protein
MSSPSQVFAPVNATNVQGLPSVRHMNKHPFDARLVFVSPAGEKNTVHRDPTCARENPEKNEPKAVWNRIQKTYDQAAEIFG